MSKQKYFYDNLDEEDVKNLDWKPTDKGNAYIVETAGFIPLEVKMKQFEQNGLIAQFQTSDFDSNDFRDIYLNPAFEITPEDDLEDITEKINARNEYIKKLKESKVGDSERIANSASDSAAAVTEEKQTVEPKEKVNQK